MSTVILVRHGRTTANTAGVLAGRTAGVRLDDIGRAQARATAERIAGVPLAALVTSPQERCRQTARAIADAHPDAPATLTDRGLAECDYGEWQGRPIKELAQEPLWNVVQRQPSAARFPGGESMVEMHHRAVDAVRRRDALIEAEHGPGAVWVAVSHGDVIKAVLADALGLHLDLFQRLHVDPASVSVVQYTLDRPYVLASNTHAGDLAWLRPSSIVDSPEEPAAPTGVGAGVGAGVIGGGAGPTASPPAGS